LETAYLYIPKACVNSDSACALHLVLHGCAQSADTIGTAFIEQSGYLEWADANDIVLAFPQVEKSVVAPLNPHACWDWWGYTGDDYAYRSGPQMSVLVDWIWSLQN
jgi:poly(3-hydroxybutyrate) depolymerase